MILEENFLEKIFEKELNQLDLFSGEKQFIEGYMKKLKSKHLPTRNHSMRVFLNGIKTSKIIHVEPNILAYSGSLHDIGKLNTNLTSLKKNKRFNKQDMIELQKHPFDGYSMLIENHPFTAEIVLRSHRFGKEPYPEELPPTIEKYSFEDRALISYCARIISLLDFYDACLYRKNERNSPGNPRFLGQQETKEILFSENKDQKYLIRELYLAGIFK